MMDVTLREPGSTLRVLAPCPHVLAFYDGRRPGTRLFSHKENWLDDGAYSLGIASYAVLDGAEALVFDTHLSPAHAQLVRDTLEARGVRRIRVALSHWHDDHVAGNAVFSDCEIIANQDTAALLSENRERLETAFPPICPLVMPNRLFSGRLSLTVGRLSVTLQQMDIHTRDGTVALLPDGLILAGDVLEDPTPYVDEPERLATHLRGLEHLAALQPHHILPAHGDEAMIAAGGYGPALITANRIYLERLLRLKQEPERVHLPLSDFAADAFATGALHPFAPYEEVHRQNVARVLAVQNAA
ncbi:MAG: MBL fold metallo-hydrolase [Xanthobacter sp.]